MMQNPLYVHLDLGTGIVRQIPISDEYFKKYIGGKTLAARLLLDMTRPGIDSLDPESMIIINTGPLNGTGAPSSSRFNITFKNVLSGGIASSNCGGQFGVMLRRAGYEGLILTGKAQNPSVVQVIDGEVTLVDAGELWGLDMEETQEKLPHAYGKLVIGPAGENLVRFASAGSGERMAGRCGCGAVLGSKNVKAIVAYGTKRPEVHDPVKFNKFVRKWVKFIKNHPMTGEALPRYGSAGLVSKANATHALPTRNFKYGQFENADKVSGEMLTETKLTRNGNCISCPIRCERRVMVRGKEVKGPEYETMGFFGPNIDSDDLDAILELNYVCDTLGMDTISAASTIAFAMELKENGIADFGVEFGKTDNLAEVLHKIAFREGECAELANGSKWLSEKYGGKEYAIHAKGLELASYEPRRSVGMGLGYATANRGGCHLNGGYLALLESVGVLSMDAQTPKGKAEFTVFMQDALEAVSSAGFCLFSAQTFVTAIFFKLGPAHWFTRFVGRAATRVGGAVRLMLRSTSLLRFNSFYLLPHAEAIRLATGFKMYTGQFIDLGERAFNLERMYNLREGLTSADDTLPSRLTKDPQDKNRPDTVVSLDAMLPRYYKTRGWDEQGRPTAKRLNQLKIEV
ncbi:aldehyde ferredoxin oxidoreductase family protein [Eubacteriales bacterium OttesenSCG-928-K08]|nr:aldehyde ferredoxin oxidoreductase family protein [Eubacteriales bacterium OttesenSCG-928-K08]